MHTNFADWYRMLSIDLSKVPLDLRWLGVDAAAKKITKSNALDLVRVFFDMAAKNASFENEFRSAFKTADPAFPMRDNKLELQVLAAAVITCVLDGDDVEIGDLIALAISCADFQGLRPKLVLSELIDMSLYYLHDRSNEIRTVMDPVAISQISKSTVVSEAVKAQPDAAVTWTAIQPVLEKIESTPNKLVKPLNDAFRMLIQAINMQQEESNMLWWLFSRYSRDLKRKMSDLEKAASLVAGKELADLTSTLPGPVAAEAFLHRMLETSDGNINAVTLREALSTPVIKDWKSQSTGQLNLDSCGDICTLHFAIRQSAESDSDSEWMPSFAKRSGLSADDQIQSVALATQAYRERLLMKALS